MPRLIEKIWTPDSSYGRSRKDSKPFRYKAFVPDPIGEFDPELPISIAAKVERATRAAIDLDSSPRTTDLEPVARLLLRAESVASSRIEGLRVSHRRLEEAAFEPRAAPTVALDVVRNIEAMNAAVEIGARAGSLGVEDLCEIQATLLDNDRDRHIAGVIRTEQNWIGRGMTPRTAVFIPPPPEYVLELMKDLIKFCERDDLQAVTQAALAHSQFETIHPFADGNGRTGRCLIHILLRRRGLSRRVVPPVSVVLAANTDRYIRGLTDYRSGDVGAWCATFAEAVESAGLRATDLGRSLGELRSEWLTRARLPRQGSTARRLIEGLSGHPLLSVASAAELLGVSEEASRLALNQLSSSGVVRQVTVGRRNRAWAADEIFDLLDEFDFGMATPDFSVTPARPAPPRHRRSTKSS